MNERIIQCFNNFQIADLDDDMIEIFKTMVEWMIEIRSQIDCLKLPEPEEPFNYYKLDPHQPKMELRKNYRKLLAHAVKYQEEENIEIKLINIYVAIQAGMYLYHMPIKKINEMFQQKEITRELSLRVLLEDNMSPNWIKEPSGKDFTAIML